MTSTLEAAYHELALTNSRLRAERDELKALVHDAGQVKLADQTEIERLTAIAKDIIEICNDPLLDDDEKVEQIRDAALAGKPEKDAED